MVLEFTIGFEDARAVVTGKPMILLLVLEAQSSIMGRPTSVAPATFDFVAVVGAVIEMVPYAIWGEEAATAFGHGVDGCS